MEIVSGWRYAAFDDICIEVYSIFRGLVGSGMEEQTRRSLVLHGLILTCGSK